MKLFSKPTSDEKKELTPTQQKVKTALNWTLNVVCLVLIIFALIVAIFTIIRTANEDKITRVGDKCYFSVASDSMTPTFKVNDVIIAKAYKGDGSDLQIGQVVTFKMNKAFSDGKLYPVYNSHRIMAFEKDSTGKIIAIRTRGDKKEGSWEDALQSDTTWDARKIAPADVVATWGSVDENNQFHAGKILKGAGALGNFMQDPVSGKTRFFCLIVLPLILLFVIYAFVLVRTLIIAKLENSKQVSGERVVTVDSLSDEEKRRLAQEYLASLNADTADNVDKEVDNDTVGEQTVSEQSAQEEPTVSEQEAPAEATAEHSDDTSEQE